jgi:hypothetical protein
MESMKIAILISGEYRTFPICRKTMPFLDDERADVYISTWDRSIVKNERLNLNINETITEDGVRKDLNRSATILIEPVECFESKRYNDKMIHRWITGFEMIKNSGIEYDYVLVMRPDLFFNTENNICFDNIFNIKPSEFNVGWFNGNKGYLQDNMFACSLTDMIKLFELLVNEDWVTQTLEGDWHKWWSIIIAKYFLEITRLGGNAGFVFCRPSVKEDCTFNDVVAAEINWTNAKILLQISEFGRDFVVGCWDEVTVLRAEQSEASVKNTQRIALIVSGELRTFKESHKSWNKFKFGAALVDPYLISWTKSSGEDINFSHINSDLLVFKSIILNDNADITSDITSDARHGDTFKEYKNLLNSARMLHLWKTALNNIPFSKYDLIMVIRPDLELFEECVIEGSSGISTIYQSPDNQFPDLCIWGVSDKMKTLLQLADYDEYIYCPKHIHDFLNERFNASVNVVKVDAKIRRSI